MKLKLERIEIENFKGLSRSGVDFGDITKISGHERDRQNIHPLPDALCGCFSIKIPGETRLELPNSS